MATETKPAPSEGVTVRSVDGELIEARPTTGTVTIGGQEIEVSAEFLSILAQGGITGENIEAPAPVGSLALNPEQLCNLPTKFPGASFESAPMVLGSSEIREDFEMMPPYKGLLMAYVAHPLFGGVILRTYAGKLDEATGEIVRGPVAHHLTEVVKPGQAFKLATFPTQKGNPITKPIPV